jgi:predicted Zn-dependent peptidase
MKKPMKWLAPLLMVLIPVGLLAATPAPAPPALSSVRPRLNVETVKLSNGMTFLLVSRPGAPVYVGYIAFGAGGVDNVPGQTGLAHMFEHMAFKGTEHFGTTDWAKEKPFYEALEKAGDALTLLKVSGKGSKGEIGRLEAEVKRLEEEEHRYIVKDELDRVYIEAGGIIVNASTTPDTTQYFAYLPANTLELWMLMESQRMSEPVLREFYTERDVIAQERMLRYENDPMGKLYERFLYTAFQAAPYRNPAIGWPSDIPALTMADAKEFFRKYYSPSNAVGVLCGNFDVAQAKDLIQRYFGPLPRGEVSPPVVTREPVQETERRVDVAFAGQPALFAGYLKPTWPSRDDTVMDIIQMILADGVTSRLYRRLVEKEGLAFMVQGGNGIPGTRFDNLFLLMVIPGAGASYEKVEKVLWEELDRLKTEPVSGAELERAKTRLVAGLTKKMQENEGVCATLAIYHLITGDWRTLEQYLDGVQTVTTEEIRAAAARYFVPSNRTVARLVPPAPGAAQGAQETKP